MSSGYWKKASIDVTYIGPYRGPLRSLPENVTAIESEFTLF